MTDSSGASHSLKEIRFIAGGFFFVFAYLVTERHLVPAFEQAGYGELAYRGLMMGYLAFLVGDFTSPKVIHRFGPRLTLFLSGCCYLVLIAVIGFRVEIIQVTSGDAFEVLFVAAWLLGGFAAACLWNSMSNAAHALSKRDEGLMLQMVGSVLTYFGLGATLWLLATSYLVWLGWSYEEIFVLSLPLVGLGTLCFLRLKRLEIPHQKVSDIAAMYRNPVAWRLGTLCIVAFMVFGLLVSVIPAHIQQVVGDSAIGWMSAIAFISLIFSNAYSGAIYAHGRGLVIQVSCAVLFLGLTFLLSATMMTDGAFDFVIVGVILVALSFPPLFVIMYTIADLTPAQRYPAALAMFTSLDDGAIFVVLLAGWLLERAEIPPTWLYVPTMAVAILTLFAYAPLGRSLNEGKRRFHASMGIRLPDED